MSASVSGVPCGQVCHSEVMEVLLNSSTKGGFGLILHRQLPKHYSDGESHSDGPIASAADYTAPLFISYIERNSPAEKSGVLHVGDRILAINDWCTTTGTAEEANYIIRHAISPLTLTVEFDVIETVLPSSGVFTVKLAKRSQNLGLVISSGGGSSSQKGEPVFVSDIRTGSVAHRCGSLEAGDQLLAIDNIPLSSCTAEEAVRLLHRSNDIVKLRVRKAAAVGSAGGTAGADDAPQTVVYSIELSRRGGPLGLTIASTDEPGDPIVISQLAAGGLAERTGALHAGDRLLAINGVCLQGRRVAEAIELMRNSDDRVTLKVARCLDRPPPIHHCYQRPPLTTQQLHHQQQQHNGHERDASDKMGTPVQSIDSAVESLEESPPTSAQHSQSHHQQQPTNLTSSTLGPIKILSDAEPLSSYEFSQWKTPVNFRITVEQRNQQMAADRPRLPTPSSFGATDSGIGSGDGPAPTEANKFCKCSCQKERNSKSSEPVEDWMKILEALETVGEAEMLRKLEESILTGNVPLCDGGPDCRPQGSSYAAGCGPPTLLHKQLPYPFPPSGAAGACSSSAGTHSSGPPSASLVLNGAESNLSLNSSSTSTSAAAGQIPPPPPSLLLPNPTAKMPEDHQQKIRVTLNKDPEYNDFGFSVSDGEVGGGVYVNKVRLGGPAQKSAAVRPLDRLLKVGEHNVEHLGCVLTVPLLQSAGERVTLCLSRKAATVGGRPEAISEEDDDEVSIKDSVV